MGGTPNGSTNGVMGVPAMHSVLCLTDLYKNAIKVEKACQAPLPESRHLGVPNIKSTGISLTKWITEKEMHLSKQGMDAVFWVQNDLTQPTYINLLKDWNIFSDEEIDTWLAKETFDIYNQENLQMLGLHMRKSIKTELWQTRESTLKGRYEGPHIFVTIMHEHQTAGPAAIQQLVHELKYKLIKQVLGENVSKLCTTIYHICQQIHGMVCQNEVTRTYLNCHSTSTRCTFTKRHKNRSYAGMRYLPN